MDRIRLISPDGVEETRDKAERGKFCSAQVGIEAQTNARHTRFQLARRSDQQDGSLAGNRRSEAVPGTGRASGSCDKAQGISDAEWTGARLTGAHVQSSLYDLESQY